MRPGVKLPHEISIQDRQESGLGPIEEVSMLEIPDEDPELSAQVEETEVADSEEVADSVVEKMAQMESETTEESTDAGEEE